MINKKYNSKFRSKYGLTLAEMANLAGLGWSYCTCRNVLTLPGYEKDRKYLLSVIKKHLRKGI